MAQINDEKKETLVALGYSTHIVDAYKAYLVDLVARDGTIRDLETEYFNSWGHTGAINDQEYSFLSGEGLTGALNDMWLQHWSGALPLGVLIETPIDSSIVAGHGSYSVGPIEIDSVALGDGIVTITGAWRLT